MIPNNLEICNQETDAEIDKETNEKTNTEQACLERACIKCCFYSMCINEKRDLLEDYCGVTDEERDYIVAYPDKDSGAEIYWKEMSYYRFGGNSLEVELSEYELEEW